MKSINLAAIDLNLLVAFEAIYEEQSVTAAARRLHLGQPAVSAALGRLRLLLEDELFVRLGRDMKPTAKARQIAPELTGALQQIRRTLAASRDFDAQTSRYTFTLGSSDYASATIVPQLMRYCQQHAPGVDFRLLSFEKDQLASLFEAQTIAIALGTFHDLPRQTQQVPLLQEHFVGICRRGHPALQAGTISLQTFADLPQILVTLRRDEVGALDRLLAAQNLQRRIALTTPYFLSMSAIVAESDLVAAIPSRIARLFGDRGLVDEFNLPLEVQPWTISMIWSQLSEGLPAYAWLRQTIQTVCREL